MIRQRISQTEHELESVAKRLAEKQKQTEIGGQVDTREKRGERVVDEKCTIEHQARLIGDENVGQGKRYLTNEEDEHDGDKHEGNVAIEARCCAQLTFACAYLEQLVDDQRVYCQEHGYWYAEHEWYVEIDAHELFDTL